MVFIIFFMVNMKRIIITGLVLVTIISAFSFYLLAGKKEVQAVPVELTPVQYGPFTATALARGKIIARKKESLVAPFAGIVYDADSIPGQFLAEGTVLATVQLPAAELQKKQQEYDFAKIDLEILSEKLTHREMLLKEKAASESEVKELRSLKYKAEKIVENLKHSLGQKPVKNSFAGLLVEKRFQNGDWLAAGTLLATVVDTASFAVEISVPQHIMPHVRTGQRVVFSSDMLAGQCEGVVLEMARMASEQNNRYTGRRQSEPEFTVLATIACRNSDNLLVGAEVETRFILTQKPEALFVPLGAVLYRDGSPVVFLARNGVVFQRRIATGLMNDHAIEIVNGLSIGDTVVTTGNLDLQDGALIESTRDGTQNTAQFSRRFPGFAP